MSPLQLARGAHSLRAQTTDHPTVKCKNKPTRCEDGLCAPTSVTAGALCKILLVLGLIPSAFSQDAPSAIEEVVVTATLLSEPSAPISASVLTERNQRLRGAAHFEDLVTLVPNLTSSSGASRNRFFQIRALENAASLLSLLTRQWGSCSTASTSAAPAARSRCTI